MGELLAKRVLLVEDIREHAELFMLSAEGAVCPITVDLIEDGEAARDAFERMASGQEQPPELVMLDLNLPRLSGHDLLAFIRSKPALDALPVVITTCSEDRADVHRAAELGVSGYLVKPIVTSQLNSVLDRLYGSDA